jgi:phosphatidylserine/phosphatidylglycerophosphate/cardiolipin synthase-like enzyme
VESARHSIVCSTFNFQRSSGLWKALGAAARRPEITMRVYMDTRATGSSSPTTEEVAGHLRPGVVLRTIEFDGRYVRNHSKFICIDHRFLLVTSANFSWSAENANLEFGVLIDNRNLAEAVEHQMREAEAHVFERVLVPG